MGDAFGVDHAAIAPYLANGAAGGKAHPDDDYTLDDHWVRVDLMRRLGIIYPDFSAANGRHVVLS